MLLKVIGQTTNISLSRGDISSVMVVYVCNEKLVISTNSEEICSYFLPFEGVLRFDASLGYLSYLSFLRSVNLRTSM